MAGEEDTLLCETHGPQPETFVCQHIAKSLHEKRAVGFWWASEQSAARPDACYTACNEVLEKEGGEWNETSASFAGVKILCAACYDNARDLNFPQWRQHWK